MILQFAWVGEVAPGLRCKAAAGDHDINSVKHIAIVSNTAVVVGFFTLASSCRHVPSYSAIGDDLTGSDLWTGLHPLRQHRRRPVVHQLAMWW